MLTSQNQRFKAILQTDGDFVLYGAENPLWSTNTAERGSRVVMQHDGNLVLFDAQNNPVWSLNTQGDYFMIFDDGNMGVLMSNGKILWSSATSQSKLFLFLFKVIISML